MWPRGDPSPTRLDAPPETDVGFRMVVGNKPVAEVVVDADVARRLIAAQHPDLADLDLVPVAEGWDNAIFRLGPDLVVRLPRRAAGAALVESEIRWVPGLAPSLPLPVPTPVRVGRPDQGYPWAWTICRWQDGRVWSASPPADPIAAASTLGAFLAALHRPAPPDAPANPFRGVALPDLDERVRRRAERLSGLVDRPAVLARWDELVATDPWPGPPVWLHGDLHAGNIVVRDGAVAAVIDLGDLTAGDPATDLSAAWMVLPAEARAVFRSAVGAVDDATWDRARAWALSLALAHLESSADDPTMARVANLALDAVVVDRA